MDFKPQRCEGSTVVLNNYYVDNDGDWVVAHYVGGEDWGTIYDWYDTKEEAEQVRDHLNTTLPHQGYTHYYWSE